MPVPRRIARPSLRLLATCAFALAAGAMGCYEDPEARIAEQQLMQDMTDAVNQMGMQMAELQATVDSLKGLVAKQDTAIYRMANVTGVPYQR